MIVLLCSAELLCVLLHSIVMHQCIHNIAHKFVWQVNALSSVSITL